MMAAAAPIICPSDFARECSSDAGERSTWLFTRKSGVMLIAVVEMIGSLLGMAVYVYALAMGPDWAPILVPIPSDLCNAQTVVHGVMYIIVLLCAMEMLLAVYLLEGARQEKLGRIRFWLSSMMTYLAMVTIVILGMDLGGIRCPTMNSAAFINIFIRFLEILMVYVWAEQETMRRQMKLSRLSRRSGTCGMRQSLTGLSSLTICTLASSGEGSSADPGATPPPSYSSTIPVRSLEYHHQVLPSQTSPQNSPPNQSSQQHGNSQ